MRLLIEILFTQKSSVYDMTMVFKKYINNLSVLGQGGKIWKIKDVDCDYVSDDGTFASMNIYPENYDAEEIFIYYEDHKFCENLAKITGLDMATSEQGMQGKDYVNFDVNLDMGKYI